MAFPIAEQQRLLRRYGPWGAVTGASSGIGKELAERLAQSGLHLVLNARDAGTLDAWAAELRSRYGIQTRTAAADLSEPAGVQALTAACEGLDIGLLVACAGFGTSGLFLDAQVETEANMLRVNCEAVLRLSHHFGQRFAAQRRGGIVLMSSIVAFQGVPYAAHYAATKAYVQSLAEALAIELRPHGVDVLAAAPGPVRSGFEARADMKMDLFMTPEQVGVPVLRALGRRSSTLPGGLSKLLVGSLRTVPRWAKTRILMGIMGGMTKHQRGTGRK
ncbi:MAG: SDR family NAD(P)-dependent oxidoreductase [Bacteroidia bacterium]|nr:SDR family NAD(P)-dependent oxidoreductase [Bacteroidia bacterium]